MEIDRLLLQDIRKFIETNYENHTEMSMMCVRQEIRDCDKDTLNISFERINLFIEETWQETVLRLIDEKGLKDSYVYKKSNISKQTFSKIRSNVNYQPNKDTAIQICFGLELDIDNSLDLLGKAGYTLSRGIYRDLVIIYFIENKLYNIDRLNLYLEELNMKLFPIN